jgi:hypothetical protein
MTSVFLCAPTQACNMDIATLLLVAPLALTIISHQDLLLRLVKLMF